MELTTVAFWSSLIEIFLINLILSGDNAVVIALATLHLKEEDRKKGIFWGTFGAVALRLGLTGIAAVLLTLSYIQAIGGVLLILIALKLMKGEGASSLEENSTPYSLKDAIKTIIIADLLMSLDNVLAVAGAAGGNMQLLMLGLATSIPIVIFGSRLLSSLMRRFPWLISIGAGLLGYTAGKMILNDQSIALFADSYILANSFPILLAAGVIILGNYFKYRSSDVQKDDRVYPLQEKLAQVFAGKNNNKNI